MGELLYCVHQIEVTTSVQHKDSVILACWAFLQTVAFLQPLLTLVRRKVARRDLQQQRQRAKSRGIFVFCPSVSTPRLGGAFPSFELLYYRQMPSSMVKEAATNLQLGNNMDIQFNFLAFEHKPSTLFCLPESKTQPPYFPRSSPTNSFCYFGMFICRTRPRSPRVTTI